MPLESGSTNQETIHIKKMKKKAPESNHSEVGKNSKKNSRKNPKKEKEKRLTRGSV